MDDVAESSHQDATNSVLVVTGGHPFDSASFFEIFAANPGITWKTSTTPELGFDVVVFYDMPGITFTRHDPPTIFSAPTDDYLSTMEALMNQGTGLVFLHHAIAGWPLWEEFALLVGGRFHYQPGWLENDHYPDSGYILDAIHTVEVIEPEHDVCAGLGPMFTIRDELYCYPVLESKVLPLMRTTFPVHETQRFSSADAAIRGRANDEWTHPPGSDLVAWAKTAGRSPLVYLQFGDGPDSYNDPNFRRALANAITWTASTEGRVWASTWTPGK